MCRQYCSSEMLENSIPTKYITPKDEHHFNNHSSVNLRSFVYPVKLSKIFTYCIGRNMQCIIRDIAAYTVIIQSKAFHVIRIKFPM